MVWLTYNLNWKINNNWHLITDLNQRQFIHPTAQHLWAVRTNVRRVVNEKWDFGFGGSLFMRRSNSPNSPDQLLIPELRPHLEANNIQKLGFGVLNSRYRVEARCYQTTQDGQLSDGIFFNNFRFRWLTGLTFPILKDKKTADEIVFVRIQNEIFVNADSKIVQNIFDQNWIFLAVNFKVSDKFLFETGYLNSFQQQPLGEDFLNRNILRVTIFQIIE